MEKINAKTFSLKVYLLALIICVLMAGMLSSFPNSHLKKKKKRLSRKGELWIPGKHNLLLSLLTFQKLQKLGNPLPSPSSGLLWALSQRWLRTAGEVVGQFVAPLLFWRDAPAHWGLCKSLPLGSRMSLPCLKLGLLGDIFAKKRSIYNESWQWLVSSEALDLHTKLMKCPFFL